jgi:cytochrome c1
LRDAAEQLAKLGQLCLALPLDEGADKLGASVPSKLDRADLAKRVAISNIAVARSRQAVAVHRLNEAAKVIEEGLQAEPGRPELVALQPKVKKDFEEATSRYQDADKMRHFNKGEVHALTAIEHGLKIAVDHPQLLALKKEMSGAFEERTSPPVTPAFLAAAKVSTPAPALTEGHQLYTTRCTECHELELIDSRGMSGWEKAVSGMSRRAGLKGDEQQRILDYLAAAEIAVAALEGK